MEFKVYDLLKNLGWYVVDFIYNLLDGLLEIIQKLNAFDIINTLSDNGTFRVFYSGVIAISITLFALFIIWKIINKIIDIDDETTFKTIINESIKCGFMIILSTFLFIQVSTFSIKLSNYTANIFESNAGVTMSSSILTMFVDYTDDYKNSSVFDEDREIGELITSKEFSNDKIYLEKFVDEKKEYKYDIDWILSIIVGGFFLYSLFFAGIMLGKRQLEFLFLFSIAPIVYATSICNKQRRSAVIEQLVSLTLQSAVIMIICGLSILVMQQVNETTFFVNSFHNLIVKTLLYLGCATFILTGSTVINRFIGQNVSSANGREQLMSLMGYGKLATAGATLGGAAALGAGLVTAGLGMKLGKAMGAKALTDVGTTLGTFGGNTTNPTKTQRFINNMGARLYTMGQKGFQNKGNKANRFSPSNAFINAGTSSIGNAVKSVIPRASYNPSFYRRRNKL